MEVVEGEIIEQFGSSFFAMPLLWKLAESLLLVAFLSLILAFVLYLYQRVQKKWLFQENSSYIRCISRTTGMGEEASLWECEGKKYFALKSKEGGISVVSHDTLTKN